MQDTPDWRSAPRNVFSTEFKLRMVELAQLPGANITAIAREHGFNHNLLFKWLRLWQREGRVSRPRKAYNKTSATRPGRATAATCRPCRISRHDLPCPTPPWRTYSSSTHE